VNGAFSVEVTALDAQGQRAGGFGGSVTVSLQGAIVAGVLSGQTTVSAVNGIATFSNLRVTGLCTGCWLLATAAGLSDGTSTPFNVAGVQ